MKPTLMSGSLGGIRRALPRSVRKLCGATAAVAALLTPGTHVYAYPTGVTTSTLYKKGFLDVTLYGANKNNNTSAATTTTNAINAAINDARNSANGLAVYFPAGTYVVNGTIKAHTAGGTPDETHGVVLIGDTGGAARPVIKLANGTFPTDAIWQRNAVVEFKNFDTKADFGSPLKEKPSSGYNCMIRGIDINCGSNNAGAIGLYMNMAQESSIENVKITATGAHTGIRGLPARGWGGINIEVVEGKYGIDTMPDERYNETELPGRSNIGSVIAGLVLTNQTVQAIRHTGHPLTIVGFEITAPAGKPGVKTATEASNAPQAGALALIDGKITLTSSSQVAVDNTAQHNLCLRNIYFLGTDNLVKSIAANTPLQGSGTIDFLSEYSYTKQDGAFDSYTLLNGTLTMHGTNNGEFWVAPTTVASVPAALRTKHIPALPSIDDTGVYDPVAGGDISFTGTAPVYETRTATVSKATLQGIINGHSKIFFPAGTYTITSTLGDNTSITIPATKTIFGAGRNITHLIPDAATWKPTAVTPIFETASNADGTLYLGDLEVLVTKGNNTAYDNFNAISWRVGRKSVLHIASIGQDGSGQATNQVGRTLVSVTGNGGGRWYFFGRRSGVAVEDPNFRVLSASSTNGQALSIYGMNLEHSRSDVFADFYQCNNVRIYGLKTEFAGEFSGTLYLNTTFVNFTNCDNVALIGHSGLRYYPGTGWSAVEFSGGCYPALAALITPQDDKPPTATSGTLSETANGTTVTVPYPHSVSLFRRGTLDDSLMVHQ